MTPQTAQLSLVGVSHQTASMEEREKLVLAKDRFEDFYHGLKNLPCIQESLVLSTCNRLEIYSVTKAETSSDTIEEISEYICSFQGFDNTHFQKLKTVKSNKNVLEHIFSVASGIESQIVGETEILGQAKEAYAFARKQDSLGPVLNRLFQKTFQSAKWIRSHTSIGSGQVNVSNVAVDLAKKVFGRLETSRILVIGTGEIGEKTLKALRSRGASNITIVSRKLERASEIAENMGIEALTIEQLGTSLPEHDIVLTSTASPTPVLTKTALSSALKMRSNRPFFLIDLAIPRDIEESAAELDNVYLYNLDDLAQIADENLRLRKVETTHGRRLLTERAEKTWDHFKARFSHLSQD